MYPSYKEMAVNSLMSEFIRIVCCQTGKALFGEDGMIGLNAKNVSPVYFTTNNIINIARLLKEMPKPEGWNEKNMQKVYELAAAAEQHESDDPDHLLHTMQNMLYVCKDSDCGWLSADINNEGSSITVWLEEQVTGKSVIDWLEKVPVTKDGDTTYYKIMAANVCYNEDAGEWQLTFKAQRLSDSEIVELPGDAITADGKKDIADYIIEEARKEPSYDTPLERVGDKWYAPRRGLVEVDGTTIATAITEITSANILKVEVGTTGYKGGDSGHGGRTYLRIKDDGCTDMRCRVKGESDFDENGNRMQGYSTDNANQIEIVLGGDCELDTFTTALRFAADVLEKKANGSLILEVPKNLDAVKDEQ